MTVETEVANLTTAVDSLTSAVNVKKATLDASVANAQSARDAAAASATSANNDKLAAQAAATSATNTAAALTGFDLEAIAASKAVTAVDVFVYDTSKDSDGGAWRKRTQHTSWYNETLNTATRGSRREFPAVAVIVADNVNYKITIYDGDDPTLPMWMVFADWNYRSASRMIGTGDNGSYTACLSMLNGCFVVGTEGATSSNVWDGLYVINFTSDHARHYNSSSTYGDFSGVGIIDRNSAGYLATNSFDFGRLVSPEVNDVAMTVLPDAPIDPATGLPVPTIAVATDGGVSVIKDDGTVVDITAGAGNIWSGVSFENTGRLCAYHKSVKDLVTLTIPSADYVYTSGSDDITYNELSVPPLFNTGGYTSSGTTGDLLPTAGKNYIAVSRRETTSAGEGCSLLYENPTSPANGMVAYTTSTYNTGWMNGDIKGAFLADTDDTDLVGSGELVDTTIGPLGTTLVARGTLTDAGSGYWRLDGNDALVSVTATSDPFLTVGKTYVVTLDISAVTNATISLFQSSAQNGGLLAPAFLSANAAGVYTATIVASRDTITAFGPVSGFSANFKVSVKEADADRSVNKKGLIVNGTVTRSPVATGAELVAYSGFSASNYLEQPYNSALDFGTGDFCVMGWVKPTALTFGRTILELVGGLRVTMNTGYLTAYTTAAVTSSLLLSTGSWQFISVRRSSGSLYFGLNGVEAPAIASTGNVGQTGVMKIGYGTLPEFPGSLALLRISGTAPTAEQIAKIYNDEKVLFQENAACTLYGTSDAVTALAHDEDTGLLHVGTSAGRSVFQGLRRVSNTTTAVGTAISASNGLVVEE